MGKRLIDYLSYMEKYCNEMNDPEETKQKKAELLIQISFFQHERLIHLLVTILFAFLCVGTLFMVIACPNIALFLLVLLFLALEIPYIRHYYLLENGVQKLYTYYDKIDCFCNRK